MKRHGHAEDAVWQDVGRRGGGVLIDAIVGLVILGMVLAATVPAWTRSSYRRSQRASAEQQRSLLDACLVTAEFVHTSAGWAVRPTTEFVELGVVVHIERGVGVDWLVASLPSPESRVRVRRPVVVLDSVAPESLR